MKYLIFSFATVALLFACSPKTTEIATIENVEEGSTATNGDMPKADIAEGKVVFLENCIDCHYGRSRDNVAGLIDSYSKAEWAEILPRMIKQAELNDEKTRQVTSYIHWELEN
ncbi:MAG: hypothetical protein HWE22_03845 [Flavobacteriales bacterium]|nr:hypothetical protein [Flavobacteriales bacterium]